MTDPNYLDGFTQALKGAIAAVCPVTSLSVGDPAQASTWSFVPEPSAAPAQITAGQQAMDGFTYVFTPCVTGRQVNGQARVAGITAALNTVLTPTTSTAKPDDVRYVNSLGLDTRMPIDNPKASRVLTLSGVKDVPGFMAAALLLPV